MKKTNVCMHRIITTKPSYPWNSEKASTFWFPKFLTVTFIHHPKHTSPKNWNPIQKAIISCGHISKQCPSKSGKKSHVEKVKHFRILPGSQFIWVSLGSFSSSWLSHIWCILQVVLQGTVLKKVLQSSGIIQLLGSQLRSFDWPYSSTFITRSSHGKGVKPREDPLLSGKKSKPPKQLLEKGWHFQLANERHCRSIRPTWSSEEMETGWVFGYHFLRVFR